MFEFGIETDFFESLPFEFQPDMERSVAGGVQYPLD